MTYNLTGIGENSTTVLGFVQSVNNNLVDGWLGFLFLFVVVIISFMYFVFSTNNTSKSVSASAFVGLGLSILLRAMDLLSNHVMIAVIVVAAASVAVTWKTAN